MMATVYLIRYTDAHGRKGEVAQLHNNVQAYRTNIDPRATVQRIDLPALIEAAQAVADFSFAATMQRDDYNTSLQQFCALKHTLRAALRQPLHAEPATFDGILRGNADLVPATHTTLVHTPEPDA